MRYLAVVGWEQFQHYKHRRAPWIRMSTSILDAVEHPTFTNLTDGAKLTLHHLRLLAGVTGNQIPETWITSGHLNIKIKPRVTELLDAGFVEWRDVLASEYNGNSIASGTKKSSRAPGRARSQTLDSSLTSSVENEKKKPIRAGAREMIEDFLVTDQLRAWAAEKVPGVNVDAATEAWRDHFRNNGYRTRTGPICDADAAWRNWMRNEKKFGGVNARRNDTRIERGRITSGGERGASPDAGRSEGERNKFGQRSGADVLAELRMSEVQKKAGGGSGGDVR